MKYRITIEEVIDVPNGDKYNRYEYEQIYQQTLELRVNHLVESINHELTATGLLPIMHAYGNKIEEL